MVVPLRTRLSRLYTVWCVTIIAQAGRQVTDDRGLALDGARSTGRDPVKMRQSADRPTALEQKKEYLHGRVRHASLGQKKQDMLVYDFVTGMESCVDRGISAESASTGIIGRYLFMMVCCSRREGS